MLIANILVLAVIHYCVLSYVFYNFVISLLVNSDILKIIVNGFRELRFKASENRWLLSTLQRVFYIA